MMGLAGLLLTSTTGAKTKLMPTARPSRATIEPMRYASSSRPVAPTAILPGKAVASRIRIDGPDSRSAAMKSGSVDARWRALKRAARSYVEPPSPTMKPPTCSSCTRRIARTICSLSAAQYSPLNQGITSWATLSRSGMAASGGMASKASDAGGVVRSGTTTGDSTGGISGCGKTGAAAGPACDAQPASILRRMILA